MEVYQSRAFLPIVDVILSSDQGLNRDLSLLARSAAQEFSTLFSVPPPAGIRPVRILYDPCHPHINSHSDTTRYKVYLTVKDWYPEQLVYQLGHELCHIFADPRRTNWFVESCCAMASTVLLCRMSKLWANNPPSVKRRTPRFRQYAQERILDAEQAHEPNPRQGQVLNAEILRPLFKESLQTWNALCFLGQASTCPPADLTDWNSHQVGFSFDRWFQAVPRYWNGVVGRISNNPEGRWHYRLKP
jgi:hypothetical protein